jgi:hypothetical protein
MISNTYVMYTRGRGLSSRCRTLSCVAPTHCAGVGREATPPPVAGPATGPRGLQVIAHVTPGRSVRFNRGACYPGVPGFEQEAPVRFIKQDLFALLICIFMVYYKVVCMYFNKSTIVELKRMLWTLRRRPPSCG